MKQTYGTEKDIVLGFNGGYDSSTSNSFRPELVTIIPPTTKSRKGYLASASHYSMNVMPEYRGQGFIAANLGPHEFNAQVYPAIG
jgi:hypothetical protein